MGFPRIVSGKWEISYDVSYDLTYSTTVTETEEMWFRSPVNVPPNSSVTATCTIKESKMRVPYTIRFKTKYGYPVSPLTGAWDGITVAHVTCKYKLN